MSKPAYHIIGNWKMNGLKADLQTIEAIAGGGQEFSGVICGLCLPATLLSAALLKPGTSDSFWIGGQDCHQEKSGAYTGNISAEMLTDLGCNTVIVGHSERRAYHGETSEVVGEKAKAAQSQGLNVIVCVGETLEERKAGKAAEIVNNQLSTALAAGLSTTGLVIAYEPVWAIGTGETASLDDIKEMHRTIRAILSDYSDANGENVPIQYGGSVKPGNAKDILGIENVNGALVGGASLKAEDFLGIIEAAAALSS